MQYSYVILISCGCVAGVFVKCILFILSEINPWILICFIGMQFPFPEMQMQMSQRKKIKTHRWIWKYLKKKKKVFRYKVIEFKWSSRPRSELCISLDATLVTTQYSKYIGSYCDIDTLYSNKYKLTVAVHLCEFIPTNPFFLIIYPKWDF